MKRLFIPYYTEKNIQRKTELEYAIKKNVQSKIFDEIIFLNETSEDLENFYVGCKNVKIDKRLTFRDVFLYSNSLTSSEDVNVVINTDIYLNTIFNDVFPLVVDNVFVCMTRWELNPQGQSSLYDVTYSQDTWAWKGKVKNMDLIDTNYYLGIIGCDNRLAWEMKNKGGYKLINPSRDVPSYHVHFSGHRNYTTDVRVGGEYLWFSPHKLSQTIMDYDIRNCPFDWDENSRPDKNPNKTT